MRKDGFLLVASLLAMLAVPASAGQEFQIHLSGMQIIASDPTKRDQPFVDEVWVLSVSHSPSVPQFLRHAHRSYLKLGCDFRGSRCEQVFAVDGMDLELLLDSPGPVAISSTFRDGIFRFDADLGYGELDEHLLEVDRGRRDERLSSRLRLVGGSLDVDHHQGFCSYSFAPIVGAIGGRSTRSYFTGGVFSTAISQNASIAFVDRRTGELVGSISVDVGATDNGLDDPIHVWYTNEPAPDHAPRDLQHYLILSVLGEGFTGRAKIPVVEGPCPLATAPTNTVFCPDGQYP